MKSLAFGGLPEGALLLIDSAPIIYVLEDHPKFAVAISDRFLKRTPQVDWRFAVTTITIAEVLTGPDEGGDEALARRYRAILEFVATGRPRRGHRRKRGAIASRRCDWAWPTLSRPRARWLINAAALVTHDRDLSRVRSLRVLSESVARVRGFDLAGSGAPSARQAQASAFARRTEGDPASFRNTAARSLL